MVFVLFCLPPFPPVQNRRGWAGFIELKFEKSGLAERVLARIIAAPNQGFKTKPITGAWISLTLSG